VVEYFEISSKLVTKILSEMEEQVSDRPTKKPKSSNSFIVTLFSKAKKIIPTYSLISQLEKSLVKVTSILVRLTFICLFFLAAFYLYKDFSDTSYQIQEFHVPQRYADIGLSGNVLARGLREQISHLSDNANLTWSQKEKESYHQASGGNQIQVEVAGLGFNPQSIIKSVKQLIGLPTKEITGDILLIGNTLHLQLVCNEFSIEVENAIEADESKALGDLIVKGAKKVLEETDPLLAGVFYGGDWTLGENNRSDSTAIVMFQRTIDRKPKQAATAYAWWARTLMNFQQDTLEGVEKINKALELDPNNAFAHRTLATIQFNNHNFVEGEKLMKKALFLDPTSGHAWAYLAKKYAEKGGTRDIEAIECYEKAIALEPSNVFGFDLADLLFFGGKYDHALELIDKMENSKHFSRSDIPALKISLLDAVGKTAKAKALFEKQKKLDPHDISNRLNFLAARLGTRKNKQDLAYALVLKAIEADSLNSEAYAILTELDGLTGKPEGFYLNLEKALKLGYLVGDLNDKDEPYKTFAKEERYQRLKLKYSKR